MNSAGLPGRDRRNVVIARAAERERDVLRDAKLDQVGCQTEARCILVHRVDDDCLAGRERDRERRALESIGRKCRLADLDLVHQSVGDIPVPGKADELRVKSADMQAGPVERKAGDDKPPDEHLVQLEQRSDAHRVFKQPGFDLCCGLRFGHRGSACLRAAKQVNRRRIFSRGGV